MASSRQPVADDREVGAEVAPAPQPLAAWLAADVLAVHLHGTAQPSLQLIGLDEPADLRSLSHRRGAGRAEGQLWIALLAESPSPETMLTLAVETGREDDSAAIAPLTADLRTLLRERLASLTPADRADVLALLEDVASADPASADPLTLASSMALIREGLRDPLPPCGVERDAPQGLHLDSVIALSDTEFYVRGWAFDSRAEISRLTLISPEGSEVQLLPGAHRNARPDVTSFYDDPALPEKVGFVGHCVTRAPSFGPDGWILEMENALGVGHEVQGPAVTRDPLAARAGILSDLHEVRSWDSTLMDHVVPAVTRIQEQLEQRVVIERVNQYGEPPRNPVASIVVPLYGRIDFLEQQLAQFVHDPEIRGSDLIYVLDSPELAGQLELAAGALFALYGVPFRTVELSRNGGFSVANNRGASLARARMLLLLNSDVLPSEPGWLSRLISFYDGCDGIGALGPKLLFEDDTLQHAGIRFARPAGEGAWENEHFFKGLHGDLPAANVARPVPAVTGACMLIEHELYTELGGLSGMYVQGDYEDTDLCLRMRAAGRDTWYLPEVELYHLEGQSYGLESRFAVSRYNIWLHTRLWGDAIERAMDETSSGLPGTAPAR